MRDKKLEEDFRTLLKCVSLVYSARQSAKLKRRWPLNRMVVVAPEAVCNVLKEAEDLFLELSNVKVVEYAQKSPPNDGWATASEDNIQLFLDTRRNEALLGEGLMRDLARRVQSLRKELGYVPTDVLEAVRIAELDDESISLLKPYLKQMEELVRAKAIHLHSSHKEVEAKWHDHQLDDRKIYIAIPLQKT
jgi:isoleucyl-tRNA synthetase